MVFEPRGEAFLAEREQRQFGVFLQPRPDRAAAGVVGDLGLDRSNLGRNRRGQRLIDGNFRLFDRRIAFQRRQLHRDVVLEQRDEDLGQHHPPGQRRGFGPGQALHHRHLRQRTDRAPLIAQPGQIELDRPFGAGDRAIILRKRGTGRSLVRHRRGLSIKRTAAAS